MPWLNLLSLAIFLLFAPAGAVCADVSKAAPSGAHAKRWLLIVETSKAMQPRRQALAKTVEDLLSSSIKGQAQPGDTVGVWTFNQDAHLGRFPLQTWAKDSPAEATSRVLAFLAEQKFEKAPSLEKVLPEMAAVVKDSEFITVVLVTSGENLFSGSPFDERVNSVLQQWNETQRQERLPFVVVLRAQRGVISFCGASPAPWPVEIPALPPKPAPAIVEKKPPPPPPKPKPATAPPLIISGKKPEPEATKPSPATETSPAESTVLASAPTPHAVVAPTNANAPSASPPPDVSPTVVQSSQPGPAKADSTATPSPPPPAKTESAPAPKPEVASPPAVATALPAPQRAAVTAAVAAATAPAQVPELAPKPAEPKSAGAPGLVERVRDPEPTPAAPEPQPTPAPAPEVAVAHPPRAFASALIWGPAGALVGAGFVCGLFLLRRSRTPHVSLITRSLDREQG